MKKLVIYILQKLSSYLFVLFLLASLFIAVYIRFIGTPLNISGIYGTDAPRYIHQAKTIIEDGWLPKYEMLRAFPLGRSTDTQLTMLPYVLAFFYRLLSFLSIPVSLEQVAIISPVFFFALTFLIIFLIVWKSFDVYTALLAANLIGIAPPLIARTGAGVADRDSLTLLFAMGSYYPYILHYYEHNKFKQLALCIGSSFAMLLTGLTWPGVGVFIAVIITVELIRLCFTAQYKVNEFLLLCSWIIPLCAGLLLFKKFYHFMMEPSVFVAIGYPFLILLTGGLMLFLQYQKKVASILSLSRRIPIGFSSFLISFFCSSAVLFFIVKYGLVLRGISRFLGTFTSAFGSNPLSETISELLKAGAWTWASWPGMFFLITLSGVLFLLWRVRHEVGMNSWYTLGVFEITFIGIAFSRIFSGISPSFNETFLTVGLYWGAVVIGLFGSIFLYLDAYKKKNFYQQSTPQFCVNLFFIIWSLLTLLCWRSAVRFAFLFVVPGTILGAYAIVYGLRFCLGPKNLYGLAYFFLVILLWQLYALFLLSYSILTTYVLIGFLTLVTVFLLIKAVPKIKYQAARQVILLILLVYVIGLGSISPYMWLGGYIANYQQSLGKRVSLLKELNLEKALNWLRYNTPKDSVVAASWEYGSWINLLSNRATIVDEQQWPYWVYLMSRLVLAGEQKTEALEFLKTHSVTHLLLTSRDINYLKAIAMQGLKGPVEVPYFGYITEVIHTQGLGLEQKPLYRYRAIIKEIFLDESLVVKEKNYSPGTWSIVGIYLYKDSTGQINASVEVNLQGTIQRLPPQELFYRGILFHSQSNIVIPCTLLVNAPNDQSETWGVFYLSSKACQTMLVRIFLLHEFPETFELVYPTASKEQEKDASVEIWKIHYPPGVQTNLTYLQIQPDKELYRDWISVP